MGQATGLVGSGSSGPSQETHFPSLSFHSLSSNVQIILSLSLLEVADWLPARVPGILSLRSEGVFSSATVQSCRVPSSWISPGQCDSPEPIPVAKELGPHKQAGCSHPKTLWEGWVEVLGNSQACGGTQHKCTTSRVLFLHSCPTPHLLYPFSHIQSLSAFPSAHCDHLQTMPYTLCGGSQKGQTTQGRKVSPCGLITQGQGEFSRYRLSCGQVLFLDSRLWAGMESLFPSVLPPRQVPTVSLSPGPLG